MAAASCGGTRHVVLVGDGVDLPPGALDAAVAAAEDDVRIALVAWWSNAAGPLSFPHLNTPVYQPPMGHDSRTLTAALRADDPPIVPLLVAGGPAALLTASGLTATGGLEGDDRSSDAAIADFGLRARARGLVTVLDPSTYLFRPADSAAAPIADLGLTGADRAWLAARHPVTGSAIDTEVNDASSPMRIAHHRARATVGGMVVAVDGSCIGPLEMGTQVQILALVAALAARSEITAVHLAMPGPVPRYAETYLDHRGVHVHRSSLAEAADIGGADIVHRPYQPDGPMDVTALRSTERRVVVTLQDLISYRTGSYFPDAAEWLAARQALRSAVGGADAVLAISDDVAGAIAAEALPVGPDRLFTVPNGTDHLAASAAERFPHALQDPGLAGRQFVLVLGATYSHKQRDVALRAVGALRSRGRAISLVLAGAQVPLGSSRHGEALSRRLDDAVIDLPDVAGDERVWLLRHAEVLLYPTAAEGFGLVPFEAATLGTPSLAVDFGPLHEVGGTPPVAAASWSGEDVADGLEALLDDPDLRARQVAHMAGAGLGYTWAGTAGRLVEAYRQVLARPPRRP